MTDSFASWMIAGGSRLDDPDPRNLAHLVALRESRRDADRSPLAWLAGRLGAKASARPATNSLSDCCAAA